MIYASCSYHFNTCVILTGPIACLCINIQWFLFFVRRWCHILVLCGISNLCVCVVLGGLVERCYCRKISGIRPMRNLLACVYSSCLLVIFYWCTAWRVDILLYRNSEWSVHLWIVRPCLWLGYCKNHMLFYLSLHSWVH